VNRFTGSLLVVISSYALKITVTIAHVTSHTKSSNSSSGHISVPLELRNSSEVNSESESESYVTTDSQSASLSSNKASIWGLRPDIYESLTITVLLLWASSLTRGRVCLLYILLALASVVVLGSESLWTRNHILLSQI
jgi:hypothetical protein